MDYHLLYDRQTCDTDVVCRFDSQVLHKNGGRVFHIPLPLSSLCKIWYHYWEGNSRSGGSQFPQFGLYCPRKGREVETGHLFSIIENHQDCMASLLPTQCVHSSTATLCISILNLDRLNYCRTRNRRLVVSFCGQCPSRTWPYHLTYDTLCSRPNSEHEFWVRV